MRAAAHYRDVETPCGDPRKRVSGIPETRRESLWKPFASSPKYVPLTCGNSGNALYDLGNTFRDFWMPV